MNGYTRSTAFQVPRRLFLGAPVLLALTVWLAPAMPAAQAQDTKLPVAAIAPSTLPDPTKPATGKDVRSAGAKIEIKAQRDGATTVIVDKPGGANAGAEDAAGAASDEPAGLGVGPGRHGKKSSRVMGLGTDREFDSFGEFVHDEPALAGMVVAIVAVIFLSPVLAIALILWYRMRKARMLNETMLKLAERGVVPPAEALGVLAGNPASAIATAPSTAPIYEQAKQIRRRAAWSDLRKGVIMGGIGLGLTFYSMLDDGTPNPIGFVLLFVGIGYIVLWWFEERQIGAPPSPPAGSPGGQNGSA